MFLEDKRLDLLYGIEWFGLKTSLPFFHRIYD